MMRGTFNPDKVVDFGDGHISLTAQQQMAYVEQMHHAEVMDFNAAKKMENYKPARNPLLAEETARSQKAKVLHRNKVSPKNPAEIGIPEGGNWKSTTTYKCDEHTASQLPAPWATHYQVFERFPETVRSERSKKTRMLETKMLEIQTQLKAVEEELEARRLERVKVEASYDRTRKSSGLPPRQKGSYGKRGGAQGRSSKKRGGGKRGGRHQPKQQQPDGNTVTISDSARDYLKNM